MNVDERDIVELCTTNIGCRPICLAILDAAPEKLTSTDGDDDAEGNEVAVKSETPTKRRAAANGSARVIAEFDEDDDADDGSVMPRAKGKAASKATMKGATKVEAKVVTKAATKASGDGDHVTAKRKSQNGSDKNASFSSRKKSR